MAQQILVLASPAIGGILQYNHATVCALANLGYSVTYAEEIPDALAKLLGPDGMERTRQRANWFRSRQPSSIQHLWRETVAATEMEQIVTDAKPDLLILSNGGPIVNFLPKRAAIRSGIPFIVVEHLVHPVKPKATPEAYAELAQQYAAAKAVIAVSQNNLLLLLRKLFGLAEDHGQVIYCGRPPQYFQPSNPAVRSRLRQQWDIPNDAVVCFTAARLDIIKGYQYLLGAIKRLKQMPAWSNLYFAWAGTGTLEEHFRQAVRQTGVGDRVKFLSELADITDWLDASDVFLLPSESEGLPLAIMEAMAKGLPVAATAVSGVPEGLGDTGQLLTSPMFGDSQATIQELVTTIDRWASDATLRQEIGQAGKQRAEQLFREERMVEETIAVVRGAIDE